MCMMQAAGVTAGVLQTGEDLLENDPQLKHRNFFRELDHPEVGKHHVPGPPFKLSETPFELKRAPLVGEHNEYVLKEILGMSDEDMLLCWLTSREDLEAMRRASQADGQLSARQPLTRLIEALAERQDCARIHIQKPGLSLIMENKNATG